jgi:hypothetical protein
VTVTDTSAAWPDIPVAESRLSSAPHFAIQLDPAFECGDPIALHLALTATEAPGAWSADFSVPTGTASTITGFSDTMESGTNGWTTQQISGANPWAQVTSDSTSPTHSWKVTDISTVCDSLLVSPPIASLPANATLRFKHRFNLESDTSPYDGGVLEYSTNGTTWTDAGSLLTQGGYTETISTCCSNPLGGRQGWTRNSGGWIESRADVASLAGQTVQFRWRFGTDSSVADEGWFVDDVVIDVTTFDCASLLATPGEASDVAAGAAPFTIGKNGSGFTLAWSAPTIGGAPSGYVLYESPLVAGGPWAPACASDLGASTSGALPALADDSGFVVVARNAVGEGSYGTDSAGAERAPASGGNVCP